MKSLTLFVCLLVCFQFLHDVDKKLKTQSPFISVNPQPSHRNFTTRCSSQNQAALISSKNINQTQTTTHPVALCPKDKTPHRMADDIHIIPRHHVTITHDRRTLVDFCLPFCELLPRDRYTM